MSAKDTSANTNDVLTHPAAYREAVNHGSVEGSGGVDQCHNNPPQAAAKSDENQTASSNQGQQQDKDWDLYPQVIRKIENEGTDNQVKQLHELEHHEHQQK